MDDILSVLTRVNRKVSNGIYKGYKQMPEPKYTFTKKLVLKPVWALGPNAALRVHGIVVKTTMFHCALWMHGHLHRAIECISFCMLWGHCDSQIKRNVG